MVVRQVISRDGVGVVAHRAEEEKTREFLASKDIWFRPVQFANGPDGALYVIDMKLAHDVNDAVALVPVRWVWTSTRTWPR